MKIAVIGGGSTYTPELVAGLTRLDVDEFVLEDVDPGRREVVGGMARRMLERQGFAGRLEVTGDLDAAVTGADFVLVQIRVGGQEARLRDETVPLACGCIGQETTGAGGFAKAMRTVPVVLEIAERVRALGAPDAWIVDFTNPVGIVSRALLDGGHRAIGLCNVAIGFQRRFAAWLGVEPSRVIVDQVGLNHLTWVRRVLLDGEDVLPDLLVEHGDEIAADIELPRRLLDELGAVPSYYLRYFYAHDVVLREQLEGEPRAAVVQEIERSLLDLYRDPTVDERPDLLMQRGGAYYSEAALGLISSLATGDGAVHEVDIRNHGTLEGLAADDVVEVPARVGRDGCVPLTQAPLAPELLGLVQHVAAYERLTVRAALSRDPVDARKALLAHPLIGQVELLEGLLDRLVAEAVPVKTIFAVDGGGSKTDAALVREDGTLLGFARGPLSHAQVIGVAPSADTVDALAAEVGAPADLAVLFIAGLDFPDEEDAYLAEAERRRWATETVVGNDTFAVLRAGSARGWGIAVTCGSGMNCVGVGPDGRHVRFPSLGTISGDAMDGAGAVGLAAVGAAARSEDGRGPKSMLQLLVPEHFGCASPVELAREFHDGRIAWRRLGELAPLVFQAAEIDAVAAGIVERQAAEIVAYVRAAVQRLGVAEEEVEVVLGGGVLQSGNKRLLEGIEVGLREVGTRLRAHVATSRPIVGSVLLGLDRLGASPEAHERARSELDRATESVGDVAGDAAAVPELS